MGEIAVTQGNMSCVDWETVNVNKTLYFPDLFIDQVSNKCRNPSTEAAYEEISGGFPWCYTDSNGQKDICKIAKCGKYLQ